jgi:hypothetical protein
LNISNINTSRPAIFIQHQLNLRPNKNLHHDSHQHSSSYNQSNLNHSHSQLNSNRQHLNSEKKNISSNHSKMTSLSPLGLKVHI